MMKFAVIILLFSIIFLLHITGLLDYLCLKLFGEQAQEVKETATYLLAVILLGVSITMFAGVADILTENCTNEKSMTDEMIIEKIESGEF